MRGFFRSTFGKILISALAAILVAAALLAIFGEGFSVFRRAALTIVSPFQKAYTAVWNGMSGFFSARTKYDELLAENDALRSQMAQMEAAVREAEALGAENDALRDLLGMRRRYTEYDIISASVIGWSDTAWSSSFTVSRGSGDGVEKGDCVISQKGLVGRVTSVGPGYAVVTSVLDPASGVGVAVSRNGLATVASGELSLMKQGKLRLTNIPHGSDLLAGDSIETSGAGGQIPPGLLVGTVESVSADPGGMTEWAQVIPCEDISSLTRVYIIRDFTVEK